MNIRGTLRTYGLSPLMVVRLERHISQIFDCDMCMLPIYLSHMAINCITGRVCESCNFHGSSMIPIQEPIREQYFAGKNVCSIHQNYIALIFLAITSIRGYSGVAVMSPV